MIIDKQLILMYSQYYFCMGAGIGVGVFPFLHGRYDTLYIPEIGLLTSYLQ